MIDTHSHIYAEEFDADRDAIIQRAKASGVNRIILPNVDSESLPRMLATEAAYPGYCFAAIGLHPTSVNENYRNELNIVRQELERQKYVAVGEIGIDLYWDKTFVGEQIVAFQQQVNWALEFNLPVIIHVRESFNETMEALNPFRNSGLKGVFHSFTGGMGEATEILNFGGFFLGINGIITFKNSGLAAVVRQINPKNIVVETDAPYLTPVPYRGKRNESSYVGLVIDKLSAVYGLPVEETDRITTANANLLFGF